MSQARSDIDLDALARKPVEIQPPRRGWRRWIVPVLILGGFAGVLFSTLPDLLKETREVTVVRPRPLEGEAARRSAAGRVVAQAAGWVEPDPFPIEVTALADGVVEEMLVQESDVVERGQVVARLIDEDARLANIAAMSELARAQAEVGEAEAELGIAREVLEAALGVTEAEAKARATLEGKEAETGHREAAVKQGEARLRLAEDELAVQRELLAADATGQRQVDIAMTSVEEQQALLEILHADAALARAEMQTAMAVHTRALSDVEYRFEDRLAVDVAEARLDRARSEMQRLEARRDESALRLERMAVRAPASGVVLERMAAPGSVVVGSSAVLATLYTPDSLRVRVDVPLVDVEKLFVGQRAEIVSGARPGRPFQGSLLRVVQLADIQKVTLEAQVKVEDPDELIRPDMLVQVRFMGAELPEGVAMEAEAAESVMVPERLVSGGKIWIVDGASGLAAQRSIEIGGTDGDWVEVLDGVNLTDKLIDEGRAGLSDGARVHIIGER